MMDDFIKRILRPARVFITRLLLPDNRAMPLIERAAHLTVSGLVEGDYLEFGVFRGAYFCNAFKTLKNVHEGRIRNESGQLTSEQMTLTQEKWDRMRFFAFDSFEGLPEISGLDLRGHDFKKGQYACSEKEFLKIIKNRNIDKNVTIIKGWFNETCITKTKEMHNIEKASIVMIDCDLYESADVALRFIEDIISDGSIIIFDDFNSYRGSPLLGERRAFTEFCDRMKGWMFHKLADEPNHYSRVAFISSNLDNA